MASTGKSSQSPRAQPLGQIETPTKRLAPEDEVQFVSSKPVKKRRTSLPTGQKTAASQQPETTQPKSILDPPMDQRSDTSTPTIHEGPSVPPSEACMPSTTVARDTLTPGMEDFTFPQAQAMTATLPPQTSPILSPKQLPFEVNGPYLGMPLQQNMDLMPFPDLFNPADFDGLGSAWELANWAPQPALMTPEAALSQKMLNPPPHLQPIAQALGPPSEYSMTLPSPIPSSQFSLHHMPLTDPMLSSGQQPEAMQNRLSTPPREQAPHEGKEKTPPAASCNIKPTTHELVAPQEPPTSEAKQENSAQPQEPHAPKPPCLICAKLRQQAMMNQANGGKGLGMVAPAVTAAEHHFHVHSAHPPPLMATNPSNAPAQASRMSFQYLNSPMGMMYTNGVAPINGAMRPIPPYLLGSVLAQTTGLSGANPMMAPAVQFAPMHSLQTPQATKRPASGPAKTPAATSSPTGKIRAPAASKRKPPPNLIVDVAETCEEVFPFDEVAERHSVPRQRVVEVFSAIVQLPLLRCATDKRRSGKLAQTRMREFAKAKKESQAAGGAGKPDAAHGQAQDMKPILPGVMELARNMPPLEYPGGAKQGFTGPW